MSRARAADGLTLIELLLAMTLSLLLLGATLAVFNAMERNTHRNQDQNEAQERVRTATDLLAIRLRNLASPVAAGSTPIVSVEVATPQDLVFRSVSATGASSSGNPFNVERDRFCLASNGVIYRQTQTWTSATAPAMPTGACGELSTWTTTQGLADRVTNGSRAVFGYILGIGASVTEQTTVTGSANLQNIQGIRTTVYVDADTKVPPAESQLTTRVFLRNQNRAPIAAFDVPKCTASRQVVLNGSDSSDPEGGPLIYDWYDNGTRIGSGVTFTTQTLSIGTHTFKLTVTDSGGLSVDAPVTHAATITSTTCQTS